MISALMVLIGIFILLYIDLEISGDNNYAAKNIFCVLWASQSAGIALTSTKKMVAFILFILLTRQKW